MTTSNPFNHGTRGTHRKLRDDAFKFLEVDSGKGNCKIIGESTGNKIKFSLKYSLSAEDL